MGPHQQQQPHVGCLGNNSSLPKSRSRSRTGVRSSMQCGGGGNWPSSEGAASSCETVSVALSEVPTVASGMQQQQQQQQQEQHLVNRKALLERIEMEEAKR